MTWEYAIVSVEEDEPAKYDGTILVPFSVDATPFVKDGENELKLLVWDPSNTHLGGTGKQVLTL